MHILEERGTRDNSVWKVSLDKMYEYSVFTYSLWFQTYETFVLLPNAEFLMIVQNLYIFSVASYTKFIMNIHCFLLQRSWRRQFFKFFYPLTLTSSKWSCARDLVYPRVISNVCVKYDHLLLFRYKSMTQIQILESVLNGPRKFDFMDIYCV